MKEYPIERNVKNGAAHRSKRTNGPDANRRRQRRKVLAQATPKFITQRRTDL
jgi:hypothetical protein